MQLHPHIAAALAVVAPPPEDERTARYRHALRGHDWSHEFSEDSRSYERGRAELRYLKDEQPEVDLDFALWNAHCPEACRNGMAYR